MQYAERSQPKPHTSFPQEGSPSGWPWLTTMISNPTDIQSLTMVHTRGGGIRVGFASVTHFGQSNRRSSPLKSTLAHRSPYPYSPPKFRTGENGAEVPKTHQPHILAAYAPPTWHPLVLDHAQVEFPAKNAHRQCVLTLYPASLRRAACRAAVGTSGPWGGRP